MNTNAKPADPHNFLLQLRAKREELEKRLNHKAQPLSSEEQDKLEMEIHNVLRMKRPID